MTTITRTIQEMEVDFYGEARMVDNGIGSYEYWGAKCFDSRMEAECEDFEWDKTIRTPEENAMIEAYADENAQEICDAICDVWEPVDDRDDFPDPE